ncbi:D-amino-acid oxidase [Punctularia strigosozonata HHB-11173 SS5]|uniref:D-amino-acid oxidase n=1 Tax=Punctularia strigosozonata (strain HHB-11173) TaxID=741275 RepID=UPI0004416CCB|nr:D-amino-acid oxidase [Punctularia strigosozonata HHB-11173 SS5]EIN08914.1 D-amino-acid oxidase [Punctularia strigosozonata HHB-11173 SS5]
MSLPNEIEKKQIVVLGAGVVGLTTALKIQEKGEYNVTIVAETLPSDPKTIRYTSHWAGAHHVSLAGDDKRQQTSECIAADRSTEMDQETFRIMWDLSAPGGAAENCFLRLPQTEFYVDEAPRPHYLEIMPDFEYVEKDAIPAPCKTGIQFTTLTIDTPVYLNWLLARFLAAGGTIVKAAVQHISQVISGGAHVFTGPSKRISPPEAVVVCAGLGARFLGGVEDRDVYPIRGQTVLLRAPWVKFGRTISSVDGLWTYIIPRKGGDVIVGGIKTPDDWYPTPRPDITLDILQRSLKLAPELVPPSVRAHKQDPELTVDDLLPLVIEEGCGLRPARKGGIRLETEWVARGDEKVPVVFNYGHGGYGFQSSWGSASMAVELLENALAKKASNSDVTVGLSAEKGSDTKREEAVRSW